MGGVHIGRVPQFPSRFLPNYEGPDCGFGFSLPLIPAMPPSALLRQNLCAVLWFDVLLLYPPDVPISFCVRASPFPHSSPICSARNSPRKSVAPPFGSPPGKRVTCGGAQIVCTSSPCCFCSSLLEEPLLQQGTAVVASYHAFFGIS